MRKLCMFVLIVFIGLPNFVWAAEKPQTPSTLAGIRVVSADTVKQWLDSGEKMFLLDARISDDFKEGHLPGAIHALVPTDINIDGETIDRTVAAIKSSSYFKNMSLDSKVVAYCNAAN